MKKIMKKNEKKWKKSVEWIYVLQATPQTCHTRLGAVHVVPVSAERHAGTLCHQWLHHRQPDDWYSRFGVYRNQAGDPQTQQLETLAFSESWESYRKLWRSLDKTLVRENVLKRVLYTGSRWTRDPQVSRPGTSVHSCWSRKHRKVSSNSPILGNGMASYSSNLWNCLVWAMWVAIAASMQPLRVKTATYKRTWNPRFRREFIDTLTQLDSTEQTDPQRHAPGPEEHADIEKTDYHPIGRHGLPKPSSRKCRFPDQTVPCSTQCFPLLRIHWAYRGLAPHYILCSSMCGCRWIWWRRQISPRILRHLQWLSLPSSRRPFPEAVGRHGVL